MWRSCTFCSGFFYGTDGFCGTKCEFDFTNPPPLPKPKGRPCRFCGETLKAGDSLFCSENCRQENHEDLLSDIICAICETEFKGLGGVKYCGDDCRRVGILKNLEIRKQEKREAEKCIVCGGPKDESYVGVCSKECQILFNGREKLETSF